MAPVSNYLRDEAVQVGVRGALDVEGATAEVVNGLVVEHDGHISVLQQGMRGQHAVVRLHHGVGHLGARVHGEAQLGLLPVVHREALQEQRAQAGTRPSTHCVKHQEPLQPCAIVGQLADPVKAQVHYLLANCTFSFNSTLVHIFLIKSFSRVFFNTEFK